MSHFHERRLDSASMTVSSCRATMKICQMETSILVLAEVAWCDEWLCVDDNLVPGRDLGAVSPVPWVGVAVVVLAVLAVRQLLLDWHTAARQRCCCCEVHSHWQSAYDRDLGSAAEICISWPVLWARRQLLLLQLRPVFVMALQPGESSACSYEFADPVGSAQVVPDTSLLEQTPERAQLMSVAYLVPVGLLRRHVL